MVGPIDDKSVYDENGTDLLKTTKLCHKCRKRKPRIQFVRDLANARATTSSVCGTCFNEMLSSPTYMRNATTNLMKWVLEKDSYKVAMELCNALIAKAIQKGDVTAMKEIFDRVDGPVKQQIQIDMGKTEQLVKGAEELKASIRVLPKPNENKVTSNN